MKNIRLGDVLIEFGYITPDKLNTALASLCQIALLHLSSRRFRKGND